MTDQHFPPHTPIAGADEPRVEALFNLYHRIQSMYPLEEPDWALFQKKVQWEIRPKGAFLLRPGEVCNCVRFLHRGAVIHYDDVDEEQQLEQVGWIAQPGEMVLEINSFFQRNPTQGYLKCTLDCTFLTLSYVDLQAMYFESPAWNTIGRPGRRTYAAYGRTYPCP
ncbi:MAG: cyclic nucleotide-binding domain-containing protein [Lewinellaceae bacterium]|nr:cyclic nucleotide-binding domain-containing protein [Lewinellaceae bacterium]